METNEIKAIWKQYDAKLEKSYRLNVQLIKQMNLDKAKSSITKFTLLKGLSLAFELIVAQFLVKFIIDNFHNITLTAPAYLLAVLTYIALIWNFYQVALIIMIRYDEPVVAIQKKIEKLKIQKLKYNKFIFYWSYPFVFLMSFVVLHIDISYLEMKWFIPNIILAIIWFPFVYWLIKKYNSKNTKSKFWSRLSEESTLTPDSVSKTLNHSLRFLDEIKQFENEN